MYVHRFRLLITASVTTLLGAAINEHARDVCEALRKATGLSVQGEIALEFSFGVLRR
ncbi:hypothetical protein BRPE64_ECDS03270 (plasmid) [Caballeronia insecticola]|uniref:Uncharacterized protein n=1 Tax=Caballeronia insecticola TaxID=758793 RepID=A0A060PRF4_9BURK|nr:hypothetical protein BRPE64_ECDS03270 [Caballeronia insecticola]